MSYNPQAERRAFPHNFDDNFPAERRMSSPVMKYFSHDHLPSGPMKETSRMCGELARYMDAELPDSAEKSAGLRKLLEAKDCFVRTLL